MCLNHVGPTVRDISGSNVILLLGDVAWEDTERRNTKGTTSVAAVCLHNIPESLLSRYFRLDGGHHISFSVFKNYKVVLQTFPKYAYMNL